MNCAANPKQASAYRSALNDGWALNEIRFLTGLEVSGYPFHRPRKKAASAEGANTASRFSRERRCARIEE